MDSANPENYAWIYVHEDDWDQVGVLLDQGVFKSSISIWVLRLGSRLFHSIMGDGKKEFPTLL